MFLSSTSNGTWLTEVDFCFLSVNFFAVKWCPAEERSANSCIVLYRSRRNLSPEQMSSQRWVRVNTTGTEQSGRQFSWVFIIWANQLFDMNPGKGLSIIKPTELELDGLHLLYFVWSFCFSGVDRRLETGHFEQMFRTDFPVIYWAIWLSMTLFSVKHPCDNSQIMVSSDC